MDLSLIDTKKRSNEGSFMHLRHPSGALMHDGCDPLTGLGGDKDKKIGLHLLGKDSNKFAEIRHARANRMIADQKTVTSEEMEIDNIELLADMTIGWEYLSVAGDNVFSKASMLELYKAWPWAKNQADAWVANTANFL